MYTTWMRRSGGGGGESAVSAKCNNLSETVWEFCSTQRAWVSAENLPGSKNNIADHMLRNFNENIE